MSQPTVQPDPLSGATGLLPDAARAALQALDDTGTGMLRLEVQPAHAPGTWVPVSAGAPCTWTFRSGVFEAALADGTASFEVPAPDYPCTGTRWAVYAGGGDTQLIASAPGKPCWPGDNLRWTGVQ